MAVRAHCGHRYDPDHPMSCEECERIVYSGVPYRSYRRPREAPPRSLVRTVRHALLAAVIYVAVFPSCLLAALRMRFGGRR